MPQDKINHYMYKSKHGKKYIIFVTFCNPFYTHMFFLCQFWNILLVVHDIIASYVLIPLRCIYFDFILAFILLKSLLSQNHNLIYFKTISFTYMPFAFFKILYICCFTFYFSNLITVTKEFPKSENYISSSVSNTLVQEAFYLLI